MKIIISVGDFIDTYYKLQQKGLGFLFKRFSIFYTSRVRKIWAHVDNPPIHWWSIPKIKQRWNKAITGNSFMDYPDYLFDKYLEGKENLRMICPGCGSGSNEIKFAKFNNFNRIEGFDLSPKRINIAKENAEKMGYKNLFYFVNDIYQFDFGNMRYDLVLFDSSLHHFKNLDKILENVYNSLTSQGLLIINEYVGPNRFQWTEEQLINANKCLNKIPAVYRKRWMSNKIKSKIYRPGYLRMYLSDPSEAVKSDMILPEIRNRFTVIEEKLYGGNLLHLIFKDISHNFIEDDYEKDRILNHLFEIEDSFIKTNNHSDFIFGIYSR